MAQACTSKQQRDEHIRRIRPETCSGSNLSLKRLTDASESHATPRWLSWWRCNIQTTGSHCFSCQFSEVLVMAIVCNNYSILKVLWELKTCLAWSTLGNVRQRLISIENNKKKGASTEKEIFPAEKQLYFFPGIHCRALAGIVTVVINALYWKARAAMNLNTFYYSM